MQEIVIGNKSGDSFSVMPSNGAVISSLILDNKSVIKFPLHEGDSSKGYPSALLFPFANRVRDGKYTFENTEYQLERNELGRGHALHGFVNTMPFQVVSQRRNGVTLRCTYSGDRAGYPFPFELEITYSLVRKNTFRLMYQVVNTGQSFMPCVFGWHPYFVLQDSKVGDMSLSLPVHHTYELDDSVIPFTTNEAASPEINEATTFSLKNAILDNVYKIMTSGKEASIILSTDKLKMTVTQQIGNGLLNFFVLYTPPARNSIAIEPQTASINAFNNEDGLIILEPNKLMKGQIEVMLESL